MFLLYQDHRKWINIVKNFGCNNTTAQDIVSEMYIKIQKLIERGTNIMFDENTINYYYIFRTLNSLFIDLKRKEKNINNVDIESINLEGVSIEPDFTGAYDEIIESGESIASLSKKTKISYYSLYNTYTKVKKYLKSLL